MSNHKMGPLVAVGLVFCAGGHQLVLDRNGAQASEPVTPFTPFQAESNSYQSCAVQPSSGCMQLLDNISDPSPYQLPSDLMVCHDTGESEGASGSVCLHLGIW